MLVFALYNIVWMFLFLVLLGEIREHYEFKLDSVRGVGFTIKWYVVALVITAFWPVFILYLIFQAVMNVIFREE